MNYLLANVDFARSAAAGYQRVELRPLSDGLPGAWRRPGILDAVRAGMQDGVLSPALHGLTHFCRAAVESALARGSERGSLLRSLWQAEVPYIFWRMPWIGYEYWNPELPPEQRFLHLDVQSRLVQHACEIFGACFGKAPVSACAPGYRANADTGRAYARQGVRVMQSGPQGAMPVHFGVEGLLQVSRTVEFEPATDPDFSVARALRKAEECIARGWPVAVSVHAINFQSAMRDFRTATLHYLHDFLGALAHKFPDLLYLNDGDLVPLVNHGEYEVSGGRLKVGVRKQFRRNSERVRGAH
jgi:hypothetical protein